ncbi:MAG: sugar ABC transporter ATP-binding protein [Clostridiales Family XIII bacterium]|jgi:ribose transport system ATP-binding protein|nr:sugar ABC transporter ATP-binding protein [Clostridiales Family XIII bacterium]
MQSEYLVELSNISKEFPGVKALDSVSFDLKAGEVHALLGENGAGKSTLMKIMSGVYELDSGDFFVNGDRVTDIDPRKAQELGIAIIHQELNMCAHLTVAENIFLGREKIKGGMLDQKAMNEAADIILKELKLSLSPQTVVGNLPVSSQQMVEIAKALSTDAKVIIMDEPTSALTSKEIDELFRIINDLKKRGHGIVYISHRLEELTHIVDRVTILRDGRYIKTLNFADTNLPEIISMMVGHEINEKFPRVRCERGEKLLEVKHLNAGPLVRDVSFELYKGEIIGFAGLMGAGRTEVVKALFGANRIESGEVTLEGRRLSIRSPINAIVAGIACAPEDRKREGLCVNLHIRENVGLANLDSICGPLGVINGKKERELTARAINELKIKTPSQVQSVKNLSGGNQQKVVVGKWLVRDAKVVIFDEPTRGIDVAAKVEIYNLMNRLKEQGIGVIFVSSEMPEVLGMSDKIIVMCNGRITGTLPVEDATQDKILTLATRYETYSA